MTNLSAYFPRRPVFVVLIPEAAKELEQSIHLVKAPGAMQSEPGLTPPELAERTKVEVSTLSKREV